MRQFEKPWTSQSVMKGSCRGASAYQKIFQSQLSWRLGWSSPKTRDLWSTFPNTTITTFTSVGGAIKYEQTAHPFSQKFATIENSFADGLISSQRFLCLYFQTEQSSQDGYGVLPYMGGLLLRVILSLLCYITHLSALNESKLWNISYKNVASNSLLSSSHNY